MRHSRWRRRRYYPLFLEQLEKVIHSLSASLDLDIQWIGHISRALRGFSDINLVPIAIFQPEEIYSYSTIILLEDSISSELKQIIHNGINFLNRQLPRLATRKSIEILSQINEVANPFHICFFLPFASVIRESYDSEAFLLISFHLRKAGAESLAFLGIHHTLASESETTSINFLPFSSRLASCFGFKFPSKIAFFSAVEGISPAIVFSLLLSHKFKFSVPLYSDKIIFSLKPLCLARGIKFFSESEEDVSPFLSPIKLDTGFLFRASLTNKFFSGWSLQSKLDFVIPFWTGEAKRSPDIIALALQISSFIKYSSPDI
ncbi:MAG: hypothetical protein DRJ64_09950, partial [Thermoprotei archaeon]